ncbi:hypothetical protein NC653_030384 [Populus alba x Populus x berolinensis]|uniref:PGG domain-containing protein n=1 Tax=Populus alba x Populus x berolinensis TaxID=444605 RepID=A0AAD6Q0D6_9ROSI|nr:hypothetical protein NC653_030384 [Populus alba x Populus x berolinensis]
MGENALHVAVKNNQYKALETLIQLASQIQVGDELVNAKDEDGNTVLHLACAAKNSKSSQLADSINDTLDQLIIRIYSQQIVKLLVSDRPNVEVNAVNSEGLTALDISVTSMAGSKELEEIQEVLRSAGAEVSGRPVQAPVSNQRQQALSREDRSLTSRNENYADSLRNGVGVLAALFATSSFQLGMHPPGGFWQEWDSSTSQKSLNVTHKPGKSIIWELHKSESLEFFKMNAVCFFLSLTMLVVLAFNELLNGRGSYVFNQKRQRYWITLLHLLLGYLLVSAAEEFIRGMALVTDTSIAYISSNICKRAWILMAVYFLLAFCSLVHGRRRR